MKQSSITIGSQEYDIAVHVHDLTSPKTPILVYINEHSNSSIGCYVYTIGKASDTFTSVLQRGENASLQDLATNLSRVLSKKYSCPSYVCMSGFFSPYDYGELSRAVVQACES